MIVSFKYYIQYLLHFAVDTKRLSRLFCDTNSGELAWRNLYSSACIWQQQTEITWCHCISGEQGTASNMHLFHVSVIISSICPAIHW